MTAKLARVVFSPPLTALCKPGRLRRFEAQALHFFDRAIAVSPDDKTALQKIGGAAHKIEVIPNGIDLTEFAPHRVYCY